ncbi:CaiB/BaiF CoA transferase family protein [Microvirga sp. P5_D2]
MNAGVLSNRTVLELGSMIAAPFATHILNQLGANVIKIEPPSGETTRKLVRGGPSGTYIAYNRGKKSICLDLRSAEGQEILRRLIQHSDIVVHNLSPGAARRLNISYDDCAVINPEIIYCHIKGYGPGPLEDQIASNPIAEAATGAMYSNRINGKPSRLGPSYHDQFAGCYAVMAVLSALLNTADKSTRNIELGLYETGLHIAARDLVGVQLKSQIMGRPEQEPSPEFSIPGYGAYETKDNRWVYLVMLTDEHWRKFCNAVSVEANPELATLRQRRRQRPLVEKLVGSAVKSFNYEQITEKLSAAGVGFTEVLSSDRVLDAPQAREPKKFSEFSFANFNFEAPDLPLPSCIGEAEPNVSPPLLGEHTRELLNQIGYAEESIQSFIQNGVALVADPGAELWAPSREPVG